MALQLIRSFINYNIDESIKSTLTVCFLVCISLISCEKKDIECQECGEITDGVFIEKERFIVSHAHDSIWLNSNYKDVNNSKLSIYPCDKSAFDALEDTQIIEVTGAIVKKCNETHNYIQVSELAKVDTCLSYPSTFTYNGLEGLWVVYSIEFNGIETFTPCELNPVYLRIMIETNQISMGALHLSSEGTFKSDTIYLDSHIMTLDFAPTENGRIFRGLYYQFAEMEEIHGEQTIITYNIEQPFLTLHNIQNNAKIKLFNPNF